MQTTFRHSMIVVFPLPLSPTIMVSGFRNLITLGTKGEKERIPKIDILQISAIFQNIIGGNDSQHFLQQTIENMEMF